MKINYAIYCLIIKYIIVYGISVRSHIVWLFIVIEKGVTNLTNIITIYNEKE